MIIDSHTHYLPEEVGKFATFYNPAWMDIELQLKLMQEVGVEKSILSYPTTDAHLKIGDEERTCRLYNDGLGKIIKKYSTKFIGLSIAPVFDAKKMIYELKRAVGDLGLRGVSLASSYEGIYLDETRFFPLYEEAQRLKLPLFVHSQTQNPLGLERVKDPLLTPVIEFVFDLTMCFGRLLQGEIFKKFPALNFVFAHFAGVLPFLKDRFDNVYTMLRMRNLTLDLKSAPSDFFKKIYVDTSGVISDNILRLGIETFGTGNVLWGSDYPANRDISSSLKAIQGLCLKEEEDILAKNAERLLR